MGINRGLDFSVGLGLGWGYSQANNKGTEVAQGKNYALESICRIEQIFYLSSQAAILDKELPQSPLKETLTTLRLLSSFSLIACPTVAAIKHEKYSTIAKAVNAYLSKTGISFPEELGKTSLITADFLVKRTGTMVNIAMMTHNIAFVVAGINPYFAGAALIPFAYHRVEKWVPRKVSLEIEKRMPVLGTISNIVGGNPFLKMTSVLYVLNFCPTFAKFCQRNVEKTAKKIFRLEGPSLKEIEAPLFLDKYPSFERIASILMQDNEFYFSINPAHCSKAVDCTIKLKKNSDYSQFMNLFLKIDWSHKYSILRSSFLDDDRFIDLLKSEFPGEMDYIDNFNFYINELNRKTQISKEEYLARKLKSQMEYLVEVLKGNVQPAGTMRDLHEALNNFSQILTHLLTLTEPNQQIELEDALLKIGMAGEYCALQLKITSKDILNGILFSYLDPKECYEFRLQLALELERRQIMEGVYTQVMNVLSSSLAGEAHVMDMYRPYFSLGFVPLSKLEREAFGFIQLCNWGSPIFREIRGNMYESYQNQLKQVMANEGKLYFANYMRQALETNPLLSPNQKTILQDALQGTLDDENEYDSELEEIFIKKIVTLSAEKIEDRFFHLLLYMLGIENYNSTEDDEWQFLAPEDCVEPIGQEKEQGITKSDISFEEEFEEISKDEIPKRVLAQIEDITEL